MSNATATKPATKRAPKVTPEERKAQKLALAQETEAQLEVLKTAWTHTDGTLAAASEAFKVAKEALDVQKVYKCRIAFKVATLKSSARSKWEPNLNAAATFLGVDKATLRPYLEGGKAGAAAGFVDETGTPSKEEIKATLDGYRAATKEGKAAAKAAEAGENGGDTTTTPEPKQDPVTQDTVVKAVEELQSILKRFTREQGFSQVVGTNLQEALSELQELIELHKVDGGNA